MRLYEFKTYLTESSKLTKLKRAVYGLRGNEGIAILTPQNPNGGAESLAAKDQMSDAELANVATKNRDLLIAGKELLKELGYNYYIQKGIFEGETETSFIIFGITLDEAYALGKRWKQTAIIYITPGAKPSDREFIFVATNGIGSKEDAIMSVVREIHDLPNEAIDNMSVLGGKKYSIPFFDSKAEYKATYGVDTPHFRKAGKEQGEPLYTTKSGKPLPPEQPSVN